jgi:hypothetical protein
MPSVSTSAGTAATEGSRVNDELREKFQLRDHIGVISGLALGTAAFAFVVALAAMGDEAAVTLLVVIAVGVGLIALGTRLRG